jgi:hypothetical protein
MLPSNFIYQFNSGRIPAKTTGFLPNLPAKTKDFRKNPSFWLSLRPGLLFIMLQFVNIGNSRQFIAVTFGG